MPKTIDKIYNLRSDFSIVALTGVTGSGCSDLAKLMSGTFDDFLLQIRKVEDFEHLKNEKSSQIFIRKYERAYRLFSKKYMSYKIIAYKNVIILETLVLLLKENNNKEQAIHNFAKIVQAKFKPGIKDLDYEYSPLEIHELEENLRRWNFFEVIKEISDKIHLLGHWKQEKENWRKFVNTFFFSKIFTDFCSSFYEDLKKRDYYLKNLFVHRLSNSIRSFGNTFKTANDDSLHEADMENLFLIIGLINDIIKGASHENKRNFVIDSLRCSLEIVYMRERYNAFYMVCMHNDAYKEAINAKVSTYNKIRADEFTEKIFNLGLCEIETNSYEDGIFSVPDIYNCVANSEIHIFKRDLQNIKNECEFYSTAEQWMKIQSLILHPGLFTPSSDERCMSIAFQVKFNSGCISRQVGCIITDENYTIKSLGWNDVPIGQIPCGLTDVNELCNLDNDNDDTQIYSKFERKGFVRKAKANESFLFRDKMKETYPERKLNQLKDTEGLYVPFCFKTCYNNFQEQRDNVNTRSLHAEENTMLQVSKNGGIGLNGGKMYVTASPCVLCSKKAYQIGIREIIYLDRYTDIAEDQILDAGFNKPILRGFCGVIGATYYKLYQPFMSFKDELKIRLD